MRCPADTTGWLQCNSLRSLCTDVLVVFCADQLCAALQRVEMHYDVGWFLSSDVWCHAFDHGLKGVGVRAGSRVEWVVSLIQKICTIK